MERSRTEVQKVLSRIRALFTFSGGLIGGAVLLVAITGTAYAANEWTGDNVVDGSLTGADIASGSVHGNKIKNNTLLNQKLVDDTITGAKIAAETIASAEILNGTIATLDIADGAITSAKVLDETLTASDIATNGVNSAEIATDAVAATEIQNDSIDSGEIVDFGLSNQDIGVLFAEVQSNGTLDNSSGGGVTVGKIGTGTYEVDFARNVQACTAVATIGPSGGGSSIGEVNVADRGGNAEAVFVDTNDSAGAAADRPFRLVVVC